MAAKVVVIIKNQDARIRIGLTVEMRCRETTDTGADYDQVVDAVIWFFDRTPVPSALSGQLMSNMKRSGVIAPHSGTRGRVARETASSFQCQHLIRKSLFGHEGRCRYSARSVQ